MNGTDIIFNAKERHLYGTGDIPVAKLRAAYFEELRQKVEALYPVVDYHEACCARCEAEETAVS